MIGACSMPTGQISTQALHCMQDQIVSGAHAVLAPTIERAGAVEPCR